MMRGYRFVAALLAALSHGVAAAPAHRLLQEGPLEDSSQNLTVNVNVEIHVPQGFCLSGIVYTALLDVNAASASSAAQWTGYSYKRVTKLFGIPNKEGIAVVLAILLVLSVILTFCGQALVHTATLIITGIVMFIGFLAILWTWAQPPINTAPPGPCLGPFFGALGIAIIVVITMHCFSKKVKWLLPFNLGLALGLIFCIFIRQIILAAAPQVASEYAFDYFWLGAAVVIALTAVLAVCTMNDKNQSAVILLTFCAVGGYGIAASLSSLVMLYFNDGIRTWSFFVIMICLGLTGFLCQYCLTGDDAKEHREKTRRRARATRVRLSRSMSSMGSQIGSTDQPKAKQVEFNNIGAASAS